MLPPVARRWARANPGEDPFDWRIDERYTPETGEDDEAELRIAHLIHSPGSYCSAGSVA
ncbi:hypothetical protein [Lacisediminihabitans profunda]|uniref:hypothetical protein n=1 Tax=Lacisediminihabitans profunda TaxID=2594790 RepID=UPI00164FC6A8|nr:hypothetical protein [Lacisediminihabitans profunda]